MPPFYHLRAGFVNEKTYNCRTSHIKKNMNAVFALVFLVSAALCLVLDADAFLPALLKGGEKAVTLSVALLSVYCVWLGFFKVLEQSGLSDKLTNRLYPLSKRLFRSQDKEALFAATSNLTANFLGLPGAPTPLGIRATQKFCAAKNDYAADMLFVLNATSLQLLPVTVIALRSSLGSAAPYDIILPTLLATLCSTLLGALLVRLTAGRIFLRRRKKA